MRTQQSFPLSKALRLQSTPTGRRFLRVFRKLNHSTSKAGFAALVGLGVVGCAGHLSKTTNSNLPYNKPLVSGGAQFGALPLAVQNTVRAETGSADIANVIKDTNWNRIIYQIYFENHERFAPLYVAADGSLLDRDLMVAIGAPQDKSNVVSGAAISGVPLNDLPPAVVKAIQSQAPDAQIDSIIKHIDKDRTTYVITFKDRMHAALQLTADGTIF